jgi:hypothetical protein
MKTLLTWALIKLFPRLETRHKQGYTMEKVLYVEFEMQGTMFCSMRTPAEVELVMMPRELYWRDEKTNLTWGPFLCIRECMAHHAAQKAAGGMISGNHKSIVYVDFRTKKRIL